ncbi:MAG: hypothetical protein M1830_007338, partial [Pleopsidium flavum]
PYRKSSCKSSEDGDIDTSPVCLLTRWPLRVSVHLRAQRRQRVDVGAQVQFKVAVHLFCGLPQYQTDVVAAGNRAWEGFSLTFRPKPHSPVALGTAGANDERGKSPSKEQSKVGSNSSTSNKVSRERLRSSQ